MKKYSLILILFFTIIFSLLPSKAQTWMSTTSINCEWSDSLQKPINCQNYINPVSITYYNNIFYLLDLNTEKIFSYNTHFYSNTEGMLTYIEETADYIIMFSVTDSFILCTIITKQTKRTNLNYYFID